MRQENRRIHSKLGSVESICDNIFDLLQESLYTYEPQVANNDEEVEEIIPHFLELKIRLDKKS